MENYNLINYLVSNIRLSFFHLNEFKIEPKLFPNSVIYLSNSGTFFKNFNQLKVCVYNFSHEVCFFVNLKPKGKLK